MESHASFTSLIIVLLAAFITPIVLKKFRLSAIPVVVAEIIAGLIIGKSGFDLIHPDPWIAILSSLGFIFLMFLSGVEIDFSVFANSGKRKKLPSGRLEPNRFLISTTIFALILGISYILSLIFVWTNFTENAFFMSLVISTISLGVVVPTLKENDITKTGIGQIILLITVIADLVTMILLAVFVSFYEGSGNMWLLLILFGAGVLLYFVGKFFRNRSFFETMSTGTVQLGMRAVFTLIILLVGLSETVGAENILGAFLAGVLVSLLSPNKEMVKQLDSFGYGFLIPIFFVMVGVELDIWKLFKDPLVLVLIPLLFLALLISKLIPISIMKRWYDWPTVLGSGFIITSTLSLVVAAAKVGERIGVIDTQMSSALILLAVITCIVTPILFKKIFPLNNVKNEKLSVKIIGANQLSLPLSLELDQNRYKVCLFHLKQEKTTKDNDRTDFEVREVQDYELQTLNENNIFNCDILVVTTGDDELNAKIAIHAKEEGVERVITRVEESEVRQSLEEKKIEPFSSLLSSRTLLKAMVETPDVAKIFTSQEEHRLYQVNMSNPEYSGIELRKFPYLGNVIIVRIFRGSESIVPHGDTSLQLYDHLIVTGTKESIKELRSIIS
jgi:monovalent cation:H+ antiporter-2, CPA2 family